MRTTRLATAAIALVLSIPAALHAQGQRAGGFRGSVGVGSGNTGVSCQGCSDQKESGIDFTASLGGAVRSNLVLGGEGTLWTRSYSGGTSYSSWALATLEWYPVAGSGFFVKGGGGYSYASASANDLRFGTGVATTVASPAFEVGAGYDFLLGQHVAITPFASYLDATGGRIAVSGGQPGLDYGSAGVNLLHFGLAIGVR